MGGREKGEGRREPVKLSPSKILQIQQIQQIHVIQNSEGGAFWPPFQQVQNVGQVHTSWSCPGVHVGHPPWRLPNRRYSRRGRSVSDLY